MWRQSLPTVIVIHCNEIYKPAHLSSLLDEMSLEKFPTSFSHITSKTCSLCHYEKEDELTWHRSMSCALPRWESSTRNKYATWRECLFNRHRILYTKVKSCCMRWLFSDWNNYIIEINMCKRVNRPHRKSFYTIILEDVRTEGKVIKFIRDQRR